MPTQKSDSKLIVQQLEALRTAYGRDAADKKVALLKLLSAPFPSDAPSLLRLHEILIFLKTYPDNSAILQAAKRLLKSFPTRPEFERMRHKLNDTGISGTTIDYPFSYPMASWLAHTHPDTTEVVWEDYEETALLDKTLPLLTVPAEHPGVDDEMVSSEEWLANASSPHQTSFVSLVNRFRTLRCNEITRQHLFDSLELPLRMTLSRKFPARTNLETKVNKIHYQREPLDRDPIDIGRVVQHMPKVSRLSKNQTRMFINMARASMAVRHRELEAFDYADPEDGILFDCGRGLQIVFIGMIPERRLFLESVYGGVMIKNGVPVGYTLASGLFGSSEVAYNMFETFRGGETGWIFGRVLAAIHHLFQSTDFTIMRYQLGYENDEAIQSGAFWFYYHCGFRPRSKSILKLTETERRKIEKDPNYRSSARILRRLSTENVYFHLNESRDDIIGLFPYENIGHLVTRHIAEKYRGDRILATNQATKKVARWLGARRLTVWPPAEREAFRRWSLLIELLPDRDQWRPAEKRDLVRILWAKGGGHEASFVRLSNNHRRLRESIHQLALGQG